LERVLELEQSHGREVVRGALARAVEFGRFGHEDIAAILLAGGAAPPARLEPAQPLALGRPVGGAPARADQLSVVGMSVEALDPALVNGLRSLKLRRVRQLAPGLCQTARTQRWRPQELLRVLIEEECKARDNSNRRCG
jgi:hypothetical protein